LGSGKSLVINGGSPTRPYISSLKVNGKIWNSTWIPYSLIKNGGNISYSLSEIPNKIWGTIVNPPSFNK